MSDFAIEIVDLAKRFPVSTKSLTKRGGVASPAVFLKSLIGKSSYITALDGLSFNVPKGEVLGLLGPNGAGKTTLIKILCTLIIPDEGDAFVEGASVREKPSLVLKKLQAALTGLHGFEFRLSARQNLEFFATLYGLPAPVAKGRIDDLLSFTGLWDRQNDMVQKYSTGMIRRLTLSRALLRDSPVLLLDEPTVGLDPASAHSFRNLVREKLSKGSGKTILMSTHNLWEAEQICDRIAIIHRGQLLACDKTDKIKQILGEVQDITLSWARNGVHENLNGLIEEIRGVRGVESVEPNLDDGEMFYKITVRIKRDADISDIFSIITHNGLKLRNIQTSNPTLEDIFLRLTEEGRP
jgi:ABC-2 type transport system ATP-binding protein